MFAFPMTGQFFKSFLSRMNVQFIAQPCMYVQCMDCAILQKELNKGCSRNGTVTGTLMNESMALVMKMYLFF